PGSKLPGLLAVFFLLHYPLDCSTSLLATTVPNTVRTFLILQRKSNECDRHHCRDTVYYIRGVKKCFDPFVTSATIRICAGTTATQTGPCQAQTACCGRLATYGIGKGVG